ncbi:MAG: recO [Phycisphaerales bacterium]|nr:recO [Phycisphaerales bacterium]
METPAAAGYRDGGVLFPQWLIESDRGFHLGQAPLTRDLAVCIRKTDFSETSQILSLFGRDHGVIRVIAKGAFRRSKAGNSKFDGGIDLLDYGEAMYIAKPGRDLATLTDWKQLDGHLSLRQSLPGVLLGQAMAEILGHLLAEQDPHPPLFDRLAATLPYLASERAEEHFLALLIDVLAEAGYLPDFEEPQTPGGRADAGLARIAGTLSRLPREAGVVQRPPQLDRRQVVGLTDFLFAHVRQITNRPLFTRDFLPR